MLATIAIVLLVVWVLGFMLRLAGGFIHIVLLIALAMFLMHFLR